MSGQHYDEELGLFTISKALAPTVVNTKGQYGSVKGLVTNRRPAHNGK